MNLELFKNIAIKYLGSKDKKLDAVEALKTLERGEVTITGT